MNAPETCAAPTSVGMVDQINDSIRAKLQTLDNFEQRLSEVAMRVLGPGMSEGNIPRDMKEPGLAPVQPGLYETVTLLDQVESKHDRIRDLICKLEQL